jgi:hypothetical protein
VNLKFCDLVVNLVSICFDRFWGHLYSPNFNGDVIFLLGKLAKICSLMGENAKPHVFVA